MISPFRSLSIGISRGGGGYYPLRSELAFLANNKSANSIVDDIAGNNITLQTPHVDFANATIDAAISDAGALDISSQDMTLCGWINDKSLTNALYYVFFGKGVQASYPGRFLFMTNDTTRYFSAVVQSSGTTITINSTIASNTAGWKFLLMDVNQATKKVRFFIDNVQIGTDASFTGTFPSLAETDVKFRLHGFETPAGALTNAPLCYTSDIRFFHRLLSDTERATLFAKGDIGNEDGYWPLNNRYCNDISGNNLQPALVNSNLTLIKYSESGSFAALQRGYDLYKSAGIEDIQVPLHSDGTSPTPGNLAATYNFVKKYGTSGIHNLAESKLIFTQDNFDRSNATIYSDFARGATTFYNAAIPKLWDISEINILKFKLFLNTGYKGLIYPRYFGDKDYLIEIIGFVNEQTEYDLRQILVYTSNYEAWHEIDYYFDDRNIQAARLDYMVICDQNRYLQISTDCGVTILRQIDLNGIITATGIKFCYIYANGDILFATETKMFYSHDLLTTYTESAYKDMAGDDVTPCAADAFTCLVRDNYFLISGTEIPVWGQYSTVAPAVAQDISAWYTPDRGVTIKQFLHYTGTGQSTDLTHIHAINYNYIDGSFMLQTGDGAVGSLTAKWIKCVYDINTDSWTTETLKEGYSLNYCKTIGFAFYNNYAYWGGDSLKKGIWRVPYADILDENKYEKIFPHDNNGLITEGTGYALLGDSQNILQTYWEKVKAIDISSDKGKSWFTHELVGGPDLSDSGLFGGYATIHPANSQGYYLIHIVAVGEGFTTTFMKGTVLMLKITKP